jgi:hypothetical protein
MPLVVGYVSVWAEVGGLDGPPCLLQCPGRHVMGIRMQTSPLLKRMRTSCLAPLPHLLGTSSPSALKAHQQHTIDVALQDSACNRCRLPRGPRSTPTPISSTTLVARPAATSTTRHSHHSKVEHFIQTPPVPLLMCCCLHVSPPPPAAVLPLGPLEGQAGQSTSREVT